MSIPLLARLWSHAREALSRLRASLAPLDTLSRGERGHLSRWLAALEAFARRIVLLEALSLSSLARARSGPHMRDEPAPPKERGSRKPRLRLWPRFKPIARIRQLGRPALAAEIWRNHHRAVLIARLAIARTRRRAPHIRLADRIDALESLIAAPIRAARRLAKKLAQTPRLAIKLALAPLRAARGLDEALARAAAASARDLALNSS